MQKARFLSLHSHPKPKPIKLTRGVGTIVVLEHMPSYPPWWVTISQHRKMIYKMWPFMKLGI